MEEPITHSLLDIDFYKLTMGQLIHLKHPRVPVTLAFKNRTRSIQLANCIDESELREQFSWAQKLRFSKSELHYLRGADKFQPGMFIEPYLDFLTDFRLPEYDLRKVDGNYVLEFSGPWQNVTYWETIALSIINELYYRSLMNGLSRFERETVEAEGKIRLAEKIKILKGRSDISFIEFGTRRRFSRDWQAYVAKALAAELPARQFLGTSNTLLAMQLGLQPMGTSAHEPPMVYSIINSHGADEGSLIFSQRQVLDDWWEQYGEGLSIALSDTYGTEFFLKKVMTPKQAREWKGMRQDSGDPFAIGEKIIRFYECCNVDPTKKMLIFSDGLEIDTILRLADYFAGRIKVSFGWGTNLTNDLGFKPLSLVVKVAKADGFGAVKLSDNLAKATGLPADVERFKTICGYTSTTDIETKY